MLLIKVTLIGENTSGRNSNSIYALNVLKDVVNVVKDIQHELPIIFYGNIPYDTAATTNPGDLGFTDTLYCLKLCVLYCKRRWPTIKPRILFNVEKVWKIKENRVFMTSRNR